MIDVHRLDYSGLNVVSSGPEVDTEHDWVLQGFLHFAICGPRMPSFYNRYSWIAAFGAQSSRRIPAGGLLRSSV